MNELHNIKSIQLHNQLLEIVLLINPTNSSVLATGLIIIQNLSQNTSTVVSFKNKSRGQIENELSRCFNDHQEKLQINKIIL